VVIDSIEDVDSSEDTW